MSRAALFLSLAMTGIVGAAEAQTPSLTSEQAGRIECVAILANASARQNHGRAEGQGLPRLGIRGGIFAQRVGETVMAETGMTQDDVRDAILASLAKQRSGSEQTSDKIPGCMAMMERIVPAAPLPSPPRCAALARMASDEGSDTGAKTLADEIERKARQKLRTGGLDDAGIDEAMRDASNLVAAEAARSDTAESLDLELDACMAEATSP